jgi:hypothetical protein
MLFFVQNIISMAEKKKKKTLKALNRYKNRANELAAVL